MYLTAYSQLSFQLSHPFRIFVSKPPYFAIIFKSVGRDLWSAITPSGIHAALAHRYS
jgi:hypothetical protein